jgi:hypothetical protein
MMNTTAARAVGFFFAIVALLRFFEYRTTSTALIRLLYPGAMVSLLITGGHGGTRFEETMALGG